MFDLKQNSKPVIAVFPGQGSQHVGMAKDFYENFSKAREMFEEASDAIGLNLKKLCFDGPESDLTLTENTQPALLTASVIAFQVARAETGFTPTLVAGHSLGEYSALVAAGALPFSQAVKWVRERGLAMQKAVPVGQGTMAAVLGLEDSLVEKLCIEATTEAKKQRAQNVVENKIEATVPCSVEPANFNSPGQVVISGSTDAIQQAITLIQSDTYKGGKAMLLSVSAPFHSSLMKNARDRMATLFKNAPSAAPLLSAYIPNRTGRITQESSVVYELLVDQVDHPVLWRSSMESAFKSGHLTLVEFGPGKVLQGLAKRISKPLALEVKSTGVSDTNSLKELKNYV